MDLFDILGPVMIGPSSSHTAGSARIGRVARHLLGEDVREAVISLSGSFAKTWRGHGIDRAILGGLMDFSVDDERLRQSRELAAQRGLRYVFRTVQLPDAHPNTAVLTLTGVNGAAITLQACSVGGGRILVNTLNGLEVGFSGDMETLVIRHRDEKGVIAHVSSQVVIHGLNIATMRVFRSRAGGEAAMVLEMDERPPQALIAALRALPAISQVSLLDKI